MNSKAMQNEPGLVILASFDQDGKPTRLIVPQSSAEENPLLLAELRADNEKKAAEGGLPCTLEVVTDEKYAAHKPQGGE